MSFCSRSFDTDINHLYSRESLFEVVGLFGPLVYTLVADRHRQLDTRLTAEVESIIAASMADRGPGACQINFALGVQLELQTILCTEYRYIRKLCRNLPTNLLHPRHSYFTVINLIGGAVFRFVGDHHRQRDGVVEAEAARIDDMVERLRTTYGELV
jgi:hypothetical protein